RLSRDLYTFFRSSSSYRLRIALAYKRLEYTPHYVSLPKMEHRTPSYRALHAQGLVPLLIDGDQSFIQSMAIIEYLDEVYPEPPLMPADVHGRHYVRAVSQIIGCDYSPSQQRARAQAHPDAIRCRRGSDQELVPPLDRGGTGRSGDLPGSRGPRSSLLLRRYRHHWGHLSRAADFQCPALRLSARRLLHPDCDLQAMHGPRRLSRDAAQHSSRRILKRTASAGIDKTHPFSVIDLDWAERSFAQDDCCR